MLVFLKWLLVWMPWSLISDPQRRAQNGASPLTCFPLAALAPVPQAWRIGITVTLSPSNAWIQLWGHGWAHCVAICYLVSSWSTIIVCLVLAQDLTGIVSEETETEPLVHFSTSIPSFPEHQGILFFPLIWEVSGNSYSHRFCLCLSIPLRTLYFGKQMSKIESPLSLSLSFVFIFFHHLKENLTTPPPE